MIRIIRNDTSDEREELPGYELARACGNTVFLGLMQLFSLRNSALPVSQKGVKQVCGVRGFSCLGLLLLSRVSVLWESLSRPTHPN